MMEARLSVPASHPALPGHFPGHPVVPGVLLLDEVRVQVEACSGRRVARIVQVKFIQSLGPAEPAWLQVQIQLNRVSFRVTTTRAGDAITLAQGTLILE
jgi:3-hydroxymyristoyl/3-hydroxydecanoyl-(acyl carrier protein) dehydratase